MLDGVEITKSERIKALQVCYLLLKFINSNLFFVVVVAVV